MNPLGETEVFIDVDAAPLDGQVRYCVLVSFFAPLNLGQGSWKSSQLPLLRDRDPPMLGLEMVGTVRAVGSKASKLKEGDRVCCLHPHHFDTAVIVDEHHCQFLSAYERSEDLISQIHPLVTSLHVVETLLRLRPSDQILVDCRQEHLAYIISQVALLGGSSVYVTCHSDAGRDMLQQLCKNAYLVDRQTTFPQTLLGTSFDAILTDSNDGYQLLDNLINSGGHILALANSVPVEMANAAVSFLNKGVTIGLFDPIDGFATAPGHHCR